MNKAVFLDRDATLNSDIGHYYIYRPEDFQLNPGVLKGLKLLVDAGYKLIVVSNQGGIAKGIYGHEDVAAVHQKMKELLARAGISLTAIYYCPHHEDIAPCKCRKPGTLLFEQAIESHAIDIGKSYMIGDSERDMQAAKAVGLKGLRIEKNESILPYCLKIAQN